MEFRLVYQGALPGSGNNTRHAKEKHRIRRQIHSQLADLWKVHPLLHGLLYTPWGTGTVPDKNAFLERYAKRMFGFEFLPLVHEKLDHICSLQILLLRRENPGSLITQGGDVDNRLKTLFDALSVPDSESGLEPPGPGETPFCCLMEKDKLVTEVSVTADRLLTPKDSSEPKTMSMPLLE